MPRNQIAFSDEQLTKITSAVNKRSNDNRFTFDTLLKLIQVLALIGAGTWTIYTYVTYQRYIAQTHLDLERLTLDQKRLISGDEVRKVKAEATIREQEAEVSQQHSLNNKTKGTLTKLRVDSSGVAEYKLILSVTAQNLSNNALEIAAASVEVFTGEMTRDWNGHRAIRINFPGDYIKGRSTEGPIKWKSAMGQVVYKSPNADVGNNTLTTLVPCIGKLDTLLALQKAESGVFAFGLLEKEMSLSNELELRIRARPSDWISFRVDLFFCSGRDPKEGSYSRKEGLFELSQFKG